MATIMNHNLEPLSKVMASKKAKKAKEAITFIIVS